MFSWSQFSSINTASSVRHPSDNNATFHTFKELAISLNQVKRNFEKYGLLDQQVHFLKGWFRDTLPTAPIGKLAVLPLDGDMYEATMDALTYLYPKVSFDGYLIVDDYGRVPACKKAVHDYRQAHGILDKIVSIDWTGIYWQRTN
jgi:Macrocin-O-methyltransferase (TylF)